MNPQTLRPCLIILLLSLVTALAMAQTDQKYALTWEPVRGAGGYRIELQNEQGELMLSKTVAKEVLSYAFWLPPGTYRFRVTTLNRFMHDEKSTAWLPFSIEMLYPPQITDIQPRAIRTGHSQTITVTGNHFSRQLQACLIDPGGARTSLQIRKVGAGSLQFILPALRSAGTYGLLLSNGGKYSTMEAAAWQASYPAPVFGTIHPPQIQLGTVPPSFHIQASDLAPAPRVLMSLHDKNAETVDGDLVHGVQADRTGLHVTLDPACTAGTYDISVINREGEYPVAIGSLTLVQAPLPEPIAPATGLVDPTRAGPAAQKTAIAFPRALVLAAAWDYSVPAGAWSTVYSGSPAALNLSGDWYFTDHRLPRDGSALAFAAGLSFNLTNFSAGIDSSLVPSVLTIYALTAHPRIAFALPFMELSLAPGIGLGWATITNTSGESRSTMDFIFDADLRATFPLTEWLGVGVDLGYRHYFFTQAFDHFGLAICGEFSLSL